MGKVIISVRIVPEDQNELEKIKKEIVEKIKPEKIYEEDFVFGLKALKFEKIIDENGFNEFEQMLSNIYKNYEIEKITRVFI